jgi:polar amino acid transport system substrate-binding protein
MVLGRRALALVAALLLAGLGAGCAKAPEVPVLTPKIAPPLVADAGVLRVGVDTSYPPFAGEDKGRQAGIDVDVAAALADRFGLRLELVEISPTEAAPALADREIDLAIAGISITDAVGTDVVFAGSYLVNGAALFSLTVDGSAEPTGAPAFDPASLGNARVGCQKESAAFWALESLYGEGFAVGYTTLREALEALRDGEVDVVACDAIVGAYLARDFSGVVFVEQFGPAAPVGVVVASDAQELEVKVREALDALSVDGVLDAIRSKWVGELPVLEATASE